MKLPAGKNSPVGADLETWSALTHHADMPALESHAFDEHTASDPAWESVDGGIGASGVLGSFLIMTLDAPCRSAWQ